MSNIPPDHASTQCLVTNALSSTTPCQIKVYVVVKNKTVIYMNDEKEKKYCTLLISDASGTAMLMVYDNMVDEIDENQSWIFSHVKTKKIRNDLILTTTSISTCLLSTEVISLSSICLIDMYFQTIESNLDRIKETLAINLLDEETIFTCVDEIADVKKKINCISCRQPMIQVEGKEHLLNCKKCSRYSLIKRCDVEASITLCVGECFDDRF